MIKLYKNKAVLHSLVWLAIYLFINTITGNVASNLEVNNYLVSCIPNFILAVVCFIYFYKNKISNDIGLLCKPKENAEGMLFYIPLFVLPLLPLLYGINTAIKPFDLLALFLMYIGVGFMEEIIFRGLMFKALTNQWNRVVVVAFISFTFAIGHIASMVAIGQSGFDTILQIINALVVGFMFMTVMLASKNLTVCVIAHIAYNFIANISLMGSTKTAIIIINTVITLLYFIYLIFYRKNIKAYFNGTTDI